MGRIRTTKPEFHSDEDLSRLPAETHLFAAALLNYADDYGYFNANPALVKAGTNPLREDKTKVPMMLKQLEQIGYIEIRQCGSRSIGKIRTFGLHQKVSHPTDSKLSDKFNESLPNNSGETPEPLRPEGKGKEQGTGKGKEQGGAAAPVLLEIPAWLDFNAWQAFLEMRRKIGKPCTPRAMELLIRKLQGFEDRGVSSTRALEESTMNCWQGVFEPKEHKNGTNQRNSRIAQQAEELRKAGVPVPPVAAENGAGQASRPSWGGHGDGSPGVVLEGHSGGVSGGP
jgi:predicted RNA binding protein YcfA (HicA-like mRNA interferase family)